MPLFSNASPFDADVDRVTDEINTEENWALILDICDRAKQSQTACKDCLRSILRRLRHRVPHVAMQSLTLLNACVKNCGHTFHLEIASRDFISECRSLVTDKTHPKVALQLKLYIKSWADGEFKSDSSLSLIPTFYSSLVSEGHSFVSDDVPKSKVVVSKDPNVVSSQEEEEDVARAIALSLQDADKKGKTQQASSLYPSMTSVTPNLVSKNREPRKVRALYDFEAVEDNELTFKTGEIIGVIDDSDVNWWKGVSWRGEGLFPANFVTSDLSTEPDAVSDVAVEPVTEQNVEPIRIDEELIDRALVMIQNADPTGEADSDVPELAAIEERCYGMTPLIDQELEKADRQHGSLTEVNSRLMDALQLYHSLMQEQSTFPVASGAAVPTYMSLSRMYDGQQSMTLGQVPSGITADVGARPGMMPPVSQQYYSHHQPQPVPPPPPQAQYLANNSYATMSAAGGGAGATFTAPQPTHQFTNVSATMPNMQLPATVSNAVVYNGPAMMTAPGQHQQHMM